MRPPGVDWCNEFPTSTSLDDLVEPFRDSVKQFVEALRSAGAGVIVSATLRPRERAYLMHWCCQVADGYLPASVPPMAGVDIDWTHGDDLGFAVQACRAMRYKYNIVHAPALDSNHVRGLAIDMTVSWRGGIVVRDAHGVDHFCREQHDLWSIGATYGVRKLPSDPPHWSQNGH